MAFTLIAATASAAFTRPYKFQITGTPGGPFGSASCGLTVDPGTQDIYVLDDGDDAVDIFSSSGVYQSQISGASVPAGEFSHITCSVAVNDANHDVYVVDSAPDLIYEFDSSGNYLGTLSASETVAKSTRFGVGYDAVAVDQSTGDVYVSDPSDQVIDKFNASGTLLLEIPDPELHVGLAVDSSGDVYAANGNAIVEFESTGHKLNEFPAQPVNNHGNPLAAAGTLVVASSNGLVEEFDSSDALLDQASGSNTPAGSFSTEGVAVGPSGNLYVADSAHSVIDVFGAAATLPDATTEEASKITSITATLNGHVDPAGGPAISNCHFEVVDDTIYRAQGGFSSGAIDIPCEQFTPISSATDVTAAPTGLAPDTTYHVRLVAVNASGEEHGSDQLFETIGPPTSSEESATEVTKTTATLQAQINPHGFAATYRFQYVDEEHFKSGGFSNSATKETTESAPIGEDSSDHAVAAAIAGLDFGTTYHFRVIAVSECEAGRECLGEGEDATFTTEPALRIDSTNVTDVSSISATLGAQIDPLGDSATYHFEYLSEAEYEENLEMGHGGFSGPKVPISIPVHDAAIASSEADEVVSQHAQGLTPSTAYRYRVVAVGEFAEVAHTYEGPGQTFTTQRSGESPTLPDGRQWELVSPQDKHGAMLVGFAPGGTATQASEDGGAITYAASSPTEATPPGDQSPERVQVFSTRSGGAGGAGSSSSWASRDIATPHDAPTLVAQTGNESEYKLFSGDLSFGLVEPVGETPLSPETSEHTPYLRDNASDSYQPLVTAVNAPGAKFANQVGFVGATPDFSHVVLQSGVGLVGAGAGGGLYEWSAGKPPSEQLQQLGVLPKSEGGAVVGDGDPSPRFHELSDDGSVFFDSGGHIYLQNSQGKTMRLRTLPGDPSEGAESFFYASTDGSTLLFRDPEQLTAAPGGGIYECRLAEVAGQLQCARLTLTGMSFAGVFIGGSEDASDLYFANGDTLSVDRREGSTWQQQTIATVSGDDSGDWSVPNGELSRLTSRVSPNGRWLAFMSNSSLTGYDNVDANPGAYEKQEIPQGSGKFVNVEKEGRPVPAHDEEVYLYDAEANRLLCASCNPTGARPTGIFDIGKSPTPLVDTAKVWNGRWLAGLIPGWTPISAKANNALYQSRYLSDGGRLFFESSDALVPQDTDGTEDVYEYEPAVGAGGGPGGTELSPAQAPPNDSCLTGSSTYSARSEGCISLISSGTSGEESAFLDASENGDDVFFLTASKLVPQDTETSLSLYDAHVCGAEGVPCPPPPPATPPVCTNSDSCRAAPSPQPGIFGSPPSATFSGVGNITPEVAPPPKKVTKKTVKCKRGYVKKKVKKKEECIKKKKSNKSAHKSAKGRK